MPDNPYLQWPVFRRSVVAAFGRSLTPLNAFDPNLVDLLVARSTALGVDVRLGTRVTRIRKAGTVFTVHTESEGTTLQLDAEMVVHGSGRVPEIDDLHLDAAGVTWGRHGVTVNDYLQSVSNPAVYAAGDAAASGAPRLTPVAGYDGRIVSPTSSRRRAGRRQTSRRCQASCSQSHHLASVGLLESVARERGPAFDVHRGDTASWYSPRRVGETHSGFMVLVEKSSGRILGARALGPHADDAIKIFAMAMRTGATAASLKEMLFAYPTAGSAIPYMV